MNESWLMALLGGLLIGLSASLLLWMNGRVAGNSGIISQSFDMNKEVFWRWAYLGGLFIGAMMYRLCISNKIQLYFPSSSMILIISGLLVGFGTLLGSGCTSGHGVCGLARFSLRSLVATVVFMLTAMVTVWLVRQAGGVWW